MFHIFGYNFFNFCPFGASQSPECSFFIENQFCKFSICKKVHFCIQFCVKVGTLGKLEKKIVFGVLLIRSFKLSLRSTLKAPNCRFFMGNPWGTFKSGQNLGFFIVKLKKRQWRQKITLKMAKNHFNRIFCHSSLNFGLSACCKGL